MRRTSPFSVLDQQLDLFVSAGGDIAARDAQDLMAWPFFSLAKSKRVRPIDFRMGEVSILVEATAEHGMATIWDADVLIWVASQIVEARDMGRPTSRLIAATRMDSRLHPARHRQGKLRAAQGRAGSPAIDYDRDLDPPARRTASAPLLVDQ